MLLTGAAGAARWCLVGPGAGSHLYGAAGAARHLYGAAGAASHLYGAAGAADAAGPAGAARCCWCCSVLPGTPRHLQGAAGLAQCCLVTLLICPVLLGHISADGWRTHSARTNTSNSGLPKFAPLVARTSLGQ